MSNNVPCYKCVNRTETCHSECQLYIDWSNNRVQEREMKLGSVEYQIERYECSRKYRIKKMKGYK